MKEEFSVVKTDQNVASHFHCFSITFLINLRYGSEKAWPFEIFAALITNLGAVIKHEKLWILLYLESMALYTRRRFFKIFIGQKTNFFFIYLQSVISPGYRVLGSRCWKSLSLSLFWPVNLGIKEGQSSVVP